MSSTTHSVPGIGTCPDCTATLTQLDILLKYETTDDTMAIWAECPDCSEVVHPDR